MTILSAIETEVNNLSSKVTFKFAATLEEANANFFDKLKPEDYPVALLLVYNPNEKDRSFGRIIQEAEINMFIVDRTQQATIDVDSLDVNPTVERMRALSTELVNRLDKNDIIEETGIESVSHVSTFEPITDAHVYGDYLTFTITFSEGLTTCVPT